MGVKFQIVLPEELAEELRSTAKRLNVPVAELIRDTMRERLKVLKARPGKGKPLEWMIGLADIEDPEATRVDEILYK